MGSGVKGVGVFRLRQIIRGANDLAALKMTVTGMTVTGERRGQDASDRKMLSTSFLRGLAFYFYAGPFFEQDNCRGEVQVLLAVFDGYVIDFLDDFQRG